MNNNYYWNNKEELSIQARKHTEIMEKNYIDEIMACSNNTKIYHGNCFLLEEKFNMIIPNIIVDDIDSVSAIFKYADGNKIAVLNFASYKNPGGKFLNGSCAQEECLCHKSYLYSVLSRNMSYYAYNKHNLNKALYTDRALYSPHIRFFNGNNSTFCDVITCAAPNFTTARKYNMVSLEENYLALKNRCQFIVDIANYNKVSTLILGAFGCGVFGQNPNNVAKIFKDIIMQDTNVVQNFIFAIPNSHNNNFVCFKNVLQNN